MPMLERTAATLEPRSLQKVLPLVPTSVRSQRQLHTAFWNHGASTVELFGTCEALLGDAIRELPIMGPSEKTQEKRAETMTASAFVLEFLYPRGSLSLLRRLNRITLEGYEKPTFRFKNPLSRFQTAPLTSTAYNRPRSREAAVDTPLEDENPALDDSGRHDDSNTDIRSTESSALDEEGRDAEYWEESMSMGEVDQVTDEEEFKKFLALRAWGVAETVWGKYDRLPPDVKDDYTLEVLRYVALSHRLLDPQRYLELLSAVPALSWTEELVGGAIRAALSLNDLPTAISFGSKTMDEKALVHGFDKLVAHCLETEQWDGLLQVWVAFKTRLVKEDAQPREDTKPKKRAKEDTKAVPLELPAIVEMSELSTKLRLCWDHLRSISAQYDWTVLKETYHNLIRFLVTNSMGVLGPADAAFMVKQLGEPVPYEELIKLCVDQNEHSLAAKLYASYRKLPDAKIRIPVLRAMIQVYFPHNDHGMEMVLKDWYARYENLDYIAYRRFIQFYSGRGDVKNTFRLWREYRTVYAHKNKAVRDERTVNALVHVYAVRGELSKARQVLEEITSGRKLPVSTIHMNMLLNAHAKTWDLTGALQTFAELCDDGQPDDYSFATLMGMTGSRGNIQLTFGLYKIARDMGIEPSISMLDALVEAFCVDGRIPDAENICIMTTKRQMLPGMTQKPSDKDASSVTILWNTILSHYAALHDLDNVNRVLQLMSTHGVSYDGKTYEHILQGLVYTNQAHHALALVKLSAEKAVFRPTGDHYMLLMSGFLATREPAAVVAISKMMTEMNFPESARKMTKLIQAFGQWAQMPEGQRLGTPAHSYLVAALTAFRVSLGSEDRSGRPDDNLRSVAEQYSKVINILVQCEQFASIPETMALFESQFPENSTGEATPLKLLNSLLRAAFYEGKFDAVKQKWTFLFDKVLTLGGRPKADSLPVSLSQNPDISRELASIPTNHRYLLNESLGLVLRVLEAEEAGEGLKDLVATVEKAGFRIGQRNYNYYVQALARVGLWTEAATICEKVLMPKWSGWARRREKARNRKNALPLDLRRLGKSDAYARPNTHTLLLLIKRYMELENMAPWSTASARLLDTINETCPRFVRAAKTMVPVRSELEKDTFASNIETGDNDDDIIEYVMKEKDFFKTEHESMAAHLGAKVLPDQKGWENGRGQKDSF